MAHTNHWEDHGLYRKFTDVVSGEEILESNFALHEHPNFASIRYILNDFSDISGHTIDPDHTKVYAATDEIIASTKGKIKIAIVATSADTLELAYGYKTLMDNNTFDCEVYENLQHARDWVKE